MSNPLQARFFLRVHKEILKNLSWFIEARRRLNVAAAIGIKWCRWCRTQQGWQERGLARRFLPTGPTMENITEQSMGSAHPSDHGYLRADRLTPRAGRVANGSTATAHGRCPAPRAPRKGPTGEGLQPPRCNRGRCECLLAPCNGRRFQDRPVSR